MKCHQGFSSIISISYEIDALNKIHEVFNQENSGIFGVFFQFLGVFIIFKFSGTISGPFFNFRGNSGFRGSSGNPAGKLS